MEYSKLKQLLVHWLRSEYSKEEAERMIESGTITTVSGDVYEIQYENGSTDRVRLVTNTTYEIESA